MKDDLRFWDDIAEKYARKPLPNPDSTKRKLDIVRSMMKANDVVLDIGCGTGTIAIELSAHAAKVEGLDISGEMVRIARDKAVGQKVDNVEFHQGTVTEGLASMSEQSLDGVLAFNIFHLVEDWQGAIRRVSELLRPGGYLVSSTACLGDSWVPYKPILALMRWAGKAPRVELLRREALLQTMRECGFDNIEEPDVGAEKSTAFVVARLAEG
jgi:ubiquinone/menaquinone biosynthesis C-methylase UbiE